jgi:hypothetical protein
MLTQLGLGRYAKVITVVAGVVLGVLTYEFAGNQWVELAVAIATAVGVYAVPNTPATAVKTPTAPSSVIPTPHQGG